MDRRTFIKLTAVTGTTAGLASCGSPENQLIRFIPDEDVMPGIAEMKPGACPLCGAGCGTTVRVMQADVDVVRNNQAGVVAMSVAKKIDGNPTHPISKGALCPRGQAAIQITYHPDRLTQPMKRTGQRGSGQYQAIGWDDAINELVAKLDALADSGTANALAFWTRPGASSRHDLIALFLERFGAPAATSFSLFTDDVLRRANAISFGREQLPTLDISESAYVISFGADFLGTWNAPVQQNAAYGQFRRGRPGVRGRFVQAEPRMSLTGASADEWVAVRPGTEGVLALGLAHVIIDQKLRAANAAGAAGAAIEGWSGGLAEYAPDAVEKKTGVKADRIERLARELANASPAVAFAGGQALAQTNGLFQALAVNALNALLGSVGKLGGLNFMPQAATAASRAMGRFATLRVAVAGINTAAQSPVQVLLVDNGVNPVFATPPDWKVKEAIAKVPYVVSFGSFIDETSAMADLILPDSSFLESWTDARPESGANVALLTVAGPVMKPLHDTRATPDVLLDVAKKLKKPIKPDLPDSFDAMLTALVGEDKFPDATMQGWAELKSAGQQGQGQGSRAPAQLATDAQFDGDAGQYPYYLLPFASQTLYDGSVAHLPWLQELPDPQTTAMWSSWVELNPQTAAKLNINFGDIVEVASAHGTVRAPAALSPGTAPDIVAMPVGQGHEMFTRYASGRGVNPIKLLAGSVEAETGAPAWAATRVKISRVADADGSLVLFNKLAGETLEERADRGR